MPVNNLIDARLFVNGKALEEHMLPDGASNTHDTTTRYVEIEAGQHFEVKVRWMAGFNLRYASHLSCEIRLDNWKNHWYMLRDCRNVIHHKGAIHNDQYESLSWVLVRDEFTGQWQESQFTFGAFGTSEEAQMNISPEELSNIGSIRLSCHRAREHRRQVPVVYNSGKDQTTDEVPERFLKGKLIKNNIRFSSAIPVPPPAPEYYDYKPIDGKHGVAQHFVFLYRSRKILQSLGCIPRSPSPPLDAMLMLERTEEMLRISKQRERDANLRLLRFQEESNRQSAATRDSSIIDLDDNGTTLVSTRSIGVDINIKKEASDRTTPTIKTERHIAIEAQGRTTVEPSTGVEGIALQGVKRTRDDDNDDGFREIAPPPRKPCMVIDLTEDD